MNSAESISIYSANPGASYLRLKNEITPAIFRVLESGRYILGSECESFEKEFAEFIGVKFGVGVANGTDAIELALRASGISNNDIVVTVSNTAVATVAAIDRIGARPCLVDISPDTYTMSPDALQQAIERYGQNISAVIPVHLYGHPANLDDVMQIAKKFDLVVIEDCAQAHGAFIGRSRVGSVGHLAAFSFYPTKNLGAFGDGGAVVTNDPKYAENLKMLRQYGWRERYLSEIRGINSRLDELQAAILRVKLKYLDADNQRRRDIASIYSSELKELPIQLPITQAGNEHVFHQYTIECNKRDLIFRALEERGVFSAILYPVPIHLQKAYLGKIILSSSMHNTENAAKNILCLPLYPELEDVQVIEICKIIKSCFSA